MVITKTQRGGYLLPLTPAPVSGYSTPIITGHLPPGTISYPNAQDGGKRRYRTSRYRTRKYSNRKYSNRKYGKRKHYGTRKHTGTKKNTSKKININKWGRYLAVMAHPQK
jgi:hypothetical protein